jgi:hypothetical protein
MRRRREIPAITRLILSLLVVGAIACGAVFMALNSGPVVVKRASSAPPSRLLPYEQQIVRPDVTAATPDTPDKPEQHAMAPAGAAPAETQTGQDTQAAAPAEQGADSGLDASAPEDGGPADMAALPPDEGGPSSNPNALPWQHGGRPSSAAPGEGPDAPDPMAAQPNDDAYPPDPMAALPGEDSDPNAFPGQPQEEPQEWVQVLVSGAGMRSTASDDAPALFAFPYGRMLRVVSRYEGWVEVTDPQSAATGWMKAQYLAPAAAPGTRQEAETMYDDDEPRWRRRWLRRHGGSIGDFIGRALGGGY